MARPNFTKEEEELLSSFRGQGRSSFDILMLWSPWFAMSAALFLYGFFQHQDEFIFGGFIVTFCLFCRGIYYQIKDGGKFKQIIDKYEEACAKKG